MGEAILVIKDEMACGARGTGNEKVLVLEVEPVMHKNCLNLLWFKTIHNSCYKSVFDLFKLKVMAL